VRAAVGITITTLLNMIHLNGFCKKTIQIFFRSSLSRAFQVQGIPAVVVVDSSGEVLTRDGRSEVMTLGVGAFKVRKWLFFRF